MKRYVCWTFVSALLLVATNSFATTLIKLTDDELIQRAEYVIAGHVQKIETRLEKSNTPFQYITIKTTRIYKQNDENPLLQNEEITIRQIGGEVFGITLEVDGLPKFVENEDVVICLEQAANGLFYVIGNAQGMYHVASNELINDTTDDNTEFARKGENGEITFSAGEVRKISISSFKNKIEKVANEEAAR
ncbi:MAG: hypothetical protein V1647_06960 [Pseudomonadota bacterium]